MEESDSWEEADKQISLFLKDVVRPYFPKAYYSNTGMMGSAGAAPKNFDAHLSLNKLFDETEYVAPHEGEILHYTSIAGMLSILQENGIRLSPFSGLLDSNELIYASQHHTGVIRDRISKFSDQLKHSLYSLSGKLAELKADEMDKDTYMWETYGRGGAGVYLRLEYTDDAPQFGFGKVVYGESNLEIIKELDKKASKFFSSREFNMTTSAEFFSLIHAFHKSQRYLEEKEVRMLYDGVSYFGSLPQGARYVYEPARDGSPLKKVFIPFNAIGQMVPKLKISQIVFGYECNHNQVFKFMELFSRDFPESNFDVGRLTNELKPHWYRLKR